MHSLIYPVFVPAFWVAFWGIRNYFRYRQRMAELRLTAAIPPAAPLPDAAHEAELKMLRDRVKVLERIVVDNRHSDALAHDIEALR